VTSIPYGHQSISEDDIGAVVDVLRSDWLTQGPTIERFENAAAAVCGARYAVAMSSGTAALHAAAWAAGLGQGKRLWTSPLTFVATANCARYLGAEVDFVDIDERTLNMDPDYLARKLEGAEREGRLPDVVAPVHMCGASCDMEPIRDLSLRYGFKIIDDACHALGGSYRGLPVGSGEYSDMTILSFHPVKTITTGEGGMVVTGAADLASGLRRFRSHGIERSPEMLEQVSPGPWYYEQVELGYNYRLSDIHAALGLSQLSRLAEFVKRRQHLAGRYDEAFAGLPIQRQSVPDDVSSAFHLYVIRVAADRRTDVFGRLRSSGIGVNVHYIPVHLQPYYRRLGFGPGDFPATERYYSEAITLPLFPAMTEDEQEYVIKAVRVALSS
jgi:UDP-4-amino-4,6-dideoxy-N-acetyl-beta-L-altrosamine transaminase